VTPEQIVQAALEHRGGNELHAVFDLRAAVEHWPDCANCNERYGSELGPIRAALAQLG